jgi:hypothetical protein
MQMDHQADGAAASPAAVRVHELGAVDRKHSRRGKPFAFVVAIGLGTAPRQRHFQRDGPQTLSLLLTLLLQTGLRRFVAEHNKT